MAIYRAIVAIGARVRWLLLLVGRVVVFGVTVATAFRRPIHWRQFGTHFIEIAYFSLGVVGLTTVFSGMVLALQSNSGFGGELAEEAIPSLVVLAITRELAPVLTGLMVAGRSGSRMAAELGAMRATEQIDALKTLRTDAVSYLLTPRFYAALLALPLLVVVGDLLGVFGGWFISVSVLGIDSGAFVANARDAFQWDGFFSGVVKAAVFGIIIAVMGCWHGFHAQGGARGVGSATTNAVVHASILILAANYLVTSLFFRLVGS